MSEQTITLDDSEVRALRKTLGIASDNLCTKLGRYGPDHPAGKAAVEEARTLLNIERKLLNAIANTYTPA